MTNPTTSEGLGWVCVNLTYLCFHCDSKTLDEMMSVSPPDPSCRTAEGGVWLRETISYTNTLYMCVSIIVKNGVLIHVCKPGCHGNFCSFTN